VSLKTFLYRGLFTPLASPVNASLLFALAFVGVHFVIGWIMWRKQWFVKI
jgi:predicted acyltransferase